MRSKLFLGAAAAAITIAGVAVTVEHRANESVKAPFLHPLTIARNICSDGVDALAARRAFFVRAAQAYAQEMEAAPEGGQSLWPSVESISYSISTANPEAQSWFNQGLAFTYGFNHEEAINAFRRAQEIDPDCAMCFWGEAFALGPNINAPMFPEAVEPAYADLKSKVVEGGGD